MLSGGAEDCENSHNAAYQSDGSDRPSLHPSRSPSMIRVGFEDLSMLVAVVAFAYLSSHRPQAGNSLLVCICTPEAVGLHCR